MILSIRAILKLDPELLVVSAHMTITILTFAKKLTPIAIVEAMKVAILILRCLILLTRYEILPFRATSKIY